MLNVVIVFELHCHGAEDITSTECLDLKQTFVHPIIICFYQILQSMLLVLF